MAFARGRGGQRPSTNIWPGFVDAMTALLLVIMFVLSIFMVVQSVLRQTIDTQGHELADLAEQVAGLADALGLERDRTSRLTADLTSARDEADRQAALIATLTDQLGTQTTALDQANARIAGFEAQVADLTSSRAALEVLIAQAKARAAEQDETIGALQTQLSAAESARLAEAAAAELLRARLADADTELTAMTLALEQRRREAEETLALLAAAQGKTVEGLSEAERKRGLLATAQAVLDSEKAISTEAQRKVALLNQQMAALRSQLQSLQALLDASAAQDAEARVQIEALGTQLNSALAQVASEQKRRAELEAAERQRLEEEARALRDQTKELAQYRSEFFGKLSQVLAGREGVRVVGDRFVFSSEVLFESGSADLLPEGRAQIAGVVATLQEVAGQIPPTIDWIIRVDGHTDAVPISGGGFADNWQLSQARALSVVRYMQAELGFPPDRMAATGFGEYHPVVAGDTPEARAQNRRIELKLTER